MPYDEIFPKQIKCKKCGQEYEEHDLIKVEYYDLLHFYCQECFIKRKIVEYNDDEIIDDNEYGFF